MPQQLEPLRGRPGAAVSRIVVRRDTTTFGVGAAVVTLASGDSVVVSDSAFRVWKLGSGSLVAVSGLEGAGGYENEGQSLTLIDLSRPALAVAWWPTTSRSCGLSCWRVGAATGRRWCTCAMAGRAVCT